MVLLTNSEVRRAALVDVVARLPAEHWSLFTMATLDQALEVLSGTVATAAADDGGPS